MGCAIWWTDGPFGQDDQVAWERDKDIYIYIEREREREGEREIWIDGER